MQPRLAPARAPPMGPESGTECPRSAERPANPRALLKTHRRRDPRCQMLRRRRVAISFVRRSKPTPPRPTSTESRLRVLLPHEPARTFQELSTATDLA